VGVAPRRLLAKRKQRSLLLKMHLSLYHEKQRKDLPTMWRIILFQFFSCPTLIVFLAAHVKNQWERILWAACLNCCIYELLLIPLTHGCCCCYPADRLDSRVHKDRKFSDFAKGFAEFCCVGYYFVNVLNSLMWGIGFALFPMHQSPAIFQAAVFARFGLLLIFVIYRIGKRIFNCGLTYGGALNPSLYPSRRQTDVDGIVIKLSV